MSLRIGQNGLRAMLASIALCSAGAVLAQDLPELDALAAEIAARQAELARLTDDIEVSATRRAALAEEIAALDSDRATLAEEAIETAARIQRLEESLTATESRLARLGENEGRIRTALDARREVLAGILGALQRMGRRPPPALAVQPEDALGAVRSAMLLGAVLPGLRIEAEALAADLEALSQVRIETAAETGRLRSDAASLAEAAERLDLLMAEKRSLFETRTAELGEVEAAAATLAGEARSVDELIAGLEGRIAAARAAAEAEGADRPDADDGGRLSPAVAFAEFQGQMPLPVRGVPLLSFGEDDGFGADSHGLAVATRAGARVTSPCDAWVVYAGPFRSYGELLILDAGDGYHVLLAGMDALDVEVGQFVLTGEPVGAMGSQRQPGAAAPDVSITQPVLYIEFRKDGDSIDPAPWWAAASADEGRG